MTRQERRSPLRVKKSSSSAAAAAKQKKKDGKKQTKKAPARSKNFTQIECDTLWDICDDIVPCGAAEWNRVEELFNTKMGGLSNRSAESLKGKWKKYKQEKKPTGNPTCPPNVFRAKVYIHMYQFLFLFEFIKSNFSQDLHICICIFFVRELHIILCFYIFSYSYIGYYEGN